MNGETSEYTDECLIDDLNESFAKDEILGVLLSVYHPGCETSDILRDRWLDV